MKVSDLAGLDRIIDNIEIDLGSNAADQTISALFSDLRDELGESPYADNESGRGD